MVKEIQYPPEVVRRPYDPDFAIRGLAVDTKHGPYFLWGFCGVFCGGFVVVLWIFVVMCVVGGGGGSVLLRFLTRFRPGTQRYSRGSRGFARTDGGHVAGWAPPSHEPTHNTPRCRLLNARALVRFQPGRESS